jgi:hypothetical protein
MAKPHKNQLATLRALVEQCQRDLATLEVELRLREEDEFAPLRQRGVVRSTNDSLLRVGEDIGELKRLIEEYLRTLAK